MSTWRNLHRGALLACCLLSSAAYSENFRIDLSAGVAALGNGDYDAGGVADASFSYFISGISLTAGIIGIAELRPEDESNDTEVSIGGSYLGITKEFDLDVLKIEVGGGGVFAEVDADFRGRDVGEDDDFSPFVNVKIVKDLNSLVSLQGGLKYIDDLAGGDLYLYQAGVRFSF